MFAAVIMKATLLLLAQGACNSDSACWNRSPSPPFDEFRDPVTVPFCAGEATCYCPESGELVTHYLGENAIQFYWQDAQVIVNPGDAIQKVVREMQNRCYSVGNPVEFCEHANFIESALAVICVRAIYSYVGAAAKGGWSSAHEGLRSPLTGLFECGSLRVATSPGWENGAPTVEYVSTPDGVVRLGPGPCAERELLCIQDIVGSCQRCEQNYINKVGGVASDCRLYMLGVPGGISQEAREGSCETPECDSAAVESYEICQEVYGVNGILHQYCTERGDECRETFPAELAQASWFSSDSLVWPGRKPTPYEAGKVHELHYQLTAALNPDDGSTCWTAIGCPEVFNPDFNCMAWAFDFQHLKADGVADPYPRLPPKTCKYGTGQYYIFEKAFYDDEKYLSEYGLGEWLKKVGLGHWNIQDWADSPCQSQSGIRKNKAVIAYASDKTVIDGEIIELGVQAITHFARYEGSGSHGGRWSSKLGEGAFIVHRPLDLVNPRSMYEDEPKNAARDSCAFTDVACQRQVADRFRAGYNFYGEPYLCVYEP